MSSQKTVFDTENPQELKARCHEAIDIIEKMSPAAAKVLEEAEVDVRHTLASLKNMQKELEPTMYVSS